MDWHAYFIRLIIMMITQAVIVFWGCVNFVIMPIVMLYNTMKQEDLTFKSIFITGASRGIGSGLAEHYAKPGVHLFLYARTERGLLECKKSCEAKGANVQIYVGDVRDRKLMERSVKAADKISPIDLVVANAGISQEHNEDPQEVVDVNITGVLNTINPAIEMMKTRKKGHVCLVGSISSFFGGWTAEDCYCATKSWVLIYGRALRCNIAKDGINITTICPGLIDTEMTRAKLEEKAKTSFIGKKVAEGALSTKQCAELIAYACRRNLQDYLFPGKSNWFAAIFRSSWRRTAMMA